MLCKENILLKWRTNTCALPETVWIISRNTNNTFPSYSFFRRTSGAMYAGVPTVDFG
jgi:hypothetical protein